MRRWAINGVGFSVAESAGTLRQNRESAWVVTGFWRDAPPAGRPASLPAELPEPELPELEERSSTIASVLLRIRRKWSSLQAATGR